MATTKKTPMGGKKSTGKQNVKLPTPGKEKTLNPNKTSVLKGSGPKGHS